jgi:hypothetical protein
MIQNWTTTCINEVSSTSVSLLQNIHKYFWNNIIEHNNDPQFQAIVQFFGMIVIRILWCNTVVHPDVLVRDTVISILEKEEADDDDNIDITIRLP